MKHTYPEEYDDIDDDEAAKPIVSTYAESSNEDEAEYKASSTHSGQGNISESDGISEGDEDESANEDATDKVGFHCNIFQVLAALSTEDVYTLCPRCNHAMQRTLRKSRQDLWNALPSLFSIPNFGSGED